MVDGDGEWGGRKLDRGSCPDGKLQSLDCGGAGKVYAKKG